MVGDCRLQGAVVMGDGHCQGIGGGVVTMVTCMCIARGLLFVILGALSGLFGSLILAPWMGCLVACVVMLR